jgi:hypothetical protein
VGSTHSKKALTQVSAFLLYNYAVQQDCKTIYIVSCPYCQEIDLNRYNRFVGSRDKELVLDRSP